MYDLIEEAIERLQSAIADRDWDMVIDVLLFLEELPKADDLLEDDEKQEGMQYSEL